MSSIGRALFGFLVLETLGLGAWMLLGDGFSSGGPAWEHWVFYWVLPVPAFVVIGIEAVERGRPVGDSWTMARRGELLTSFVLLTFLLVATPVLVLLVAIKDLFP